MKNTKNLNIVLLTSDVQKNVKGGNETYTLVTEFDFLEINLKMISDNARR